jgi:hypothetical protein
MKNESCVELSRIDYDGWCWVGDWRESERKIDFLLASRSLRKFEISQLLMILFFT